MTSPLVEKARDAALAAWFANTAQGWHAAMEAAIRAYLAASPSPSEMEVVTHAIILPADHIVFGPEPFETPKGQKSEPLVTLSQAQSALAAMGAERDGLRDCLAERDQCLDELEEKHGMPWRFWSTKAQEIASKLTTAEARIKALEGALSHALDHYDRNTCLHESVHRGGSIWTICDDCGRQWADDKGGFQPHVDPAEISAARSALKENAL